MMQTALHQPVATTLRADAPVTTPTSNTTLKGTSASSALPIPQTLLPQEPARTVVTVYGPGQDAIVQVVADVLGKPWTTETSLSILARGSSAVVVGIQGTDLAGSLEDCDRSACILVNLHGVDDGSFPEESLTELCDYEFLYSLRSPFFRRDLTRFLSLILGQTRPHEDLKTKNRTNFISTTFPDVHAALPNLDILSVGSDAVEIRVDLLVDPETEAQQQQQSAAPSAVPSLRYVGQQLMLLRQHTEMPIIFTTRCTKEGGKFPMDDPNLFYRYLRRAIQWGVEYIDVELWLPEKVRRSLAEVKGNSVIMSAFHDYSGEWRWTSPEAPRIFEESAKYADIVKMIAMVDSVEANYELEYFRSTIRQTHGPYPLLSAVNMGQLGQLSRALNTVFSPITHPLLPMIAAPGQLTAAEINEALHIMGQSPKRDLYAIGSFRATPQSMFMEKCFNELSLPHTLTSLDRGPPGSLDRVITQPSFGGAALHPPIPSTARLPAISDAARAIGLVDTIVVTTPGTLIGENASWKGIRATLTRDYVPSAYRNRAAIILASTESEASASIFALRSLGVGSIYTVGFRGTGPLAEGLEPFTTIQSVKLVEQPFVIVSALPPEKALLVQPLLRHYRSTGRASPPSTRGKVYLDLTRGERNGDPLGVAVRAGWTAYGIEDVNAWTTVETMRLLVGQNVPFDFDNIMVMTSRPTVSIDRLTPRRVTAEPRESMNLDAVPKKRGPKTDVLEALLKRVDGLEKRLQDENSHPLSPASPVKERSPQSQAAAAAAAQAGFPLTVQPYATANPNSNSVAHPGYAQAHVHPQVYGQPVPGHGQSPVQQSSRIPDAMLDAYFARLHGKPFFILDEAATRTRHANGTLPAYLGMAVYALTLRYTTVNPPPGSLEYARQARRMVDIDQPSIENLQTLLLLSQTFYAYGCGKKAYMTLGNAVSMVLALDLYREPPASHPTPPAEREMRRRLFWAVYVMDRFLTCGSKRPCLVADHSIVVRLPASSSSGADPGDVFNPVGPNIPYSSDRRKTAGSSSALLVDISRILGVTHRYLAAGGVKGDSHFPWHALSNLSKIRQELDLWAAGTHDLFASIEALFGHPESTLLLLSKLIYHLVHCLLYRPFLPIDLAELRGSGQHQSWQIEATTLCFSHANAIAELVELARHAPRIEWSDLVAYCLAVAGTVHIHGVHYHGRRDGEVFASSSDFLAREMHQLAWLRQSWTGVQHHRDLLTTLSACHADLVRTLAARPVRFAPVFHLEDFLDRYPGLVVDGGHVRLVDGDEQMDLDPQLLYGPTVPSQQPHLHSHSHTHARHHSTSSASPSLSFHPHTHTNASPPTWPDIPTDPDLLDPQSHSHSHLPGTGTGTHFSPTLPQPSSSSSTSFLHPQSLGANSLQPQIEVQYATFPFEATPGPAGESPESVPSSSNAGPSGGSAGGAANEEKDPFLSLLEQIAENEHSQGGPITTSPNSKQEILLSILSEAKSLPRETDTHPTSPTPDLPSPAQQRLLDFVRRLQEQGSLSSSRIGLGSVNGYGIELDAGEDESQSQKEEEQEEGSELLRDVIRASFPSFSPLPTVAANARPGADTHPEQRQTDPETESLSTSPFEPTTASNSNPPYSSTSSGCRRSSGPLGPTKQFYNLISFLAFLTKDRLLLSPGIGERVALEMARDTLSRHECSIRGDSYSHTYSPSQTSPQKQDYGYGGITAAALWMIIMGEELYTRIRQQERESRAGTGVSGVKGRKGIVDEWETWTARLQYLSLRDDLSIEARESAAEGAAVMRRV
ncbi:type I 3-dehydroquinase-domain-containing protein [Aspergillus granulosus]|uniref:Type I 3-dehydroquinase-domain-containing protein n=1 Tax=Aspergillus granulosus TaxID=176169 RepID=A0ABR4HL50_9EURO